MRETTALFKFINYRKTSYKKPFSSNRKRINGLAQLQESIRHSLQCSLQELKSVAQFNPDLQHLCYLMSGKTKRLTSFNPDKQIRQCYADKQIKRITDRLHVIENGTPDQLKNLSQQKQKLDQDIQNLKYSLRRLGDPFSAIIRDSKTLITDQHINEIQNLAEQEPAIKRISQKLNTVRKYTEAHNHRIALNMQTNFQPNSTVLAQEAIFTIPQHNGVELDKLTMFNIVSSFYEKYLPNFSIMFAVYHANEKLVEEQTGNHIHIFIDGYNQTTGQYDLPKQLIQLATKYATYYQQPGILAGHTLSYDQNKRVGEYIQRLFYLHANKHLKSQELKLAFLPDTEQRQKIRAEIRKQADLPKDLRNFSYFKHSQKKLERLKKYTQQAILAAEKAKVTKQQAEQEANQKREVVAEIERQEKLAAKELLKSQVQLMQQRHQLQQLKKDEEECRVFIAFIFKLGEALNNWWNALKNKLPATVIGKATAGVHQVLDDRPIIQNQHLNDKLDMYLKNELVRIENMEYSLKMNKKIKISAKLKNKLH